MFYFKSYRSPTILGGLFVMRKDFFFKMGKYDEDMQIWGAENVEMSLRVCYSSFFIAII